MILRNKATGDGHTVAHNVFTAGSGAVNNLVLSGENVRKIHFQILKGGGQYRLIAMNGQVEVNGRQVAEHVLAEGDEIKAGKDAFAVELPPEPAAVPKAPAAPAGADGSDAYERLLEGVIRLLEHPDRRKSAEDVLALGMQLMDADGGYLFTLEEAGLSLLCAVPEDNDSYSHSAVKAALKNNETLIWSAASDAAAEVSVHSIEQKNIHSILVSPFAPRSSGRPAGLLYLHRKRPETPFTEPQRRLFARISQVFGAVLTANQARLEQAERIESLREIKGSGDLVHASQEMARVVEAARRAAASGVPVLIAGETGTGKDVLAGFIHERSPRAGKPFISVNCGAIPANLIESELFGHEKGAFTGAAGQQRGLFEQAHGGTLFLDEVGELPALMQVKFLRALQTGRIRRVGGEEETAVDVRVIAATNRDLAEETRAGRFREDLYYRLNLVQLKLPPLREREGDVLILAAHILKKACAAFNMNAATLTRAAEKALLKYTWPGNVRELENKIQKALLNSSSRVIDEDSLDLPEDPDRELLSLKAAREQAETRAINLALSKARGNLTLAASFLGIDRKVLRDIMERLGIRKEEFKSAREG